MKCVDVVINIFEFTTLRVARTEPKTFCQFHLMCLSHPDGKNHQQAAVDRKVVCLVSDYGLCGLMNVIKLCLDLINSKYVGVIGHVLRTREQKMNMSNS